MIHQSKNSSIYLSLHITLYHLTLSREFLTGGQVSVVQALLEELPEQFLSFMRSRDIKPQPLPPHLNQASTSTMQQIF